MLKVYIFKCNLLAVHTLRTIYAILNFYLKVLKEQLTPYIAQLVRVDMGFKSFVISNAYILERVISIVI